MESKFIDTSDPVGSTLTTGGPDRYLDQNWYYSGGMRRQTTSGARFEASQKFGYEDSNSVFFVPVNQGTARMSLSLTQPLLNGRGPAYATHLIVLAQIDTQVACDRVARDLQDLLVEVHRAYWDLYLQRSLLLQKRKLFRQAVEIHDELNGRRRSTCCKVRSPGQRRRWPLDWPPSFDKTQRFAMPGTVWLRSSATRASTPRSAVN